MSRHLDFTTEHELSLRISLAIDNSANLSPEVLVDVAASRAWSSTGSGSRRGRTGSAASRCCTTAA